MFIYQLQSLESPFFIIKQILIRSEGYENESKLHFFFVHSCASIDTETNSTSIMQGFGQTMERNGFKSAMISSIEIHKQRYITKKRFKIENGLLVEEKDTEREEKDTEREAKERYNNIIGKNLEALMRKLRNGEFAGLNRMIKDYNLILNLINDLQFPAKSDPGKNLKIEYEDFLVIFF